MIVIEIRNHARVARRESLLARLLDKVAPGTIRRRVERRVAEEIRQQLSERGIEAEVEVRRDGIQAGAGGVEGG